MWTDGGGGGWVSFDPAAPPPYQINLPEAPLWWGAYPAQKSFLAPYCPKYSWTFSAGNEMFSVVWSTHTSLPYFPAFSSCAPLCIQMPLHIFCISALTPLPLKSCIVISANIFVFLSFKDLAQRSSSLWIFPAEPNIFCGASQSTLSVCVLWLYNLYLWLKLVQTSHHPYGT